MQRLPPVLKTCALGAVLALATTARAGDLVFHLTAHGNVTAGVNRLSGVPRGHCLQCHPERQTPVLSSPVLFTVNNNTLCFTCHAATGAGQFYAGQTAYASSSHATSANMYWPGPTPLARPATDAGKCLNCHTPHGARDAQGLISNLERFREEAACLGCHDATGPASTNISAELAKRAAHPVATVTGVHLVGESAATAFGTGKRHAECVDCHNPHAGTAAGPLTGTSRVRVTNGVAGAAPSFTLVPATDTTAVKEYELCFKCHSSWTTAPAGQTDLARVLNPANESMHPVEGVGKNTSAQMAGSLDGGTGLPHLSPTTVLTCADCHSNDDLPRTVSLVAGYTGAVPRGPHGSSASGGNAAFSNAMLRAPYRKDLKPKAEAYTVNDFTLCLVCHASGPFGTTGTTARTDTAFRFHGFHLRSISGKGSGGQDISVAGAGQGNAICRECHYNTHGTRGAPWSGNATYTRGVNFSPNIVGAGGTGQPTWAPGGTVGTGSCRLSCHGMNHAPETY